MTEKTIILAGGGGTRLWPLTIRVPKPVVRLGKYFIEYTIDVLANAGLHDINVAVEYEADQIVKRLGDGSDFAYPRPLKLSYLRAPGEQEFLGTADVLRKARDQLHDSVVVYDRQENREHEVPIGDYLAAQASDRYEFKRYVDHFKRIVIASGDIIANFDIRELIEFHKKRGGIGTMALFDVKDKKKAAGFGIAKTNRHGRVLRYDEKVGDVSKVYSTDSNASFYVFEPEILDVIDGFDISELDFGKHVLPGLVGDARHELFGLRVHGIGSGREPYFNDVGTFGNMKDTAKHLVVDGVPGVDPLSRSMMPQMYLPRINGAHHRSIVGKDYPLDTKAYVDRCIIGNRTKVSPDSHLVDCIIYNNCKISGRGEGWIFGTNTTVEEGAKIGNNVVIAGDVVVKSSAVIDPGVKIAPGNTVEGKVIHDINTSPEWA